MSRRGISTGFLGVESRIQMTSRNEYFPNDTYPISSGPTQEEFTQNKESSENRYHVNNRKWSEDEPETLPPLKPNRRKGDDVELGSQKLTERNLSKHNLNRVANVNPMVSNYISPIGQLFLFFCNFFWNWDLTQISHRIQTLMKDDWHSLVNRLSVSIFLFIHSILHSATESKDKYTLPNRRHNSRLCLSFQPWWRIANSNIVLIIYSLPCTISWHSIKVLLYICRRRRRHWWSLCHVHLGLGTLE